VAFPFNRSDFLQSLQWKETGRHFGGLLK